MKAELSKREPQRVDWWKEHRTYERRLERNAANGPWIFHDGPPYANGDLHMGHFLNMVLKDVFVKIALLDGKYAKFVPGWDMHGLPIEYETLKHLGIKDFHAIDPLELRATLPGARALLARPPARPARSDGDVRPFRPAVPDDRSVVRGDDRKRARRPCRQAADLQGPAFDAVVRSRRDGARGSGDRIRDPDLAVDLRALRRGRRTARAAARGVRSRCLGLYGRAFHFSSGRRLHGRCRPTPRSRCVPTRSTASIASATRR